MKKFLILLCSGLMFSGCVLLKIPQYESWDHEVSADNYTTEGALNKYVYTDERFNQTDWFDVS